MQHEQKWWRWCAALVLLAGLLVRAWAWLSQPLLALEDGALFFARDYAEFNWGRVTMSYAGYVPFGSNVLSLLVCRLPTGWIPTAFVATAVFMMVGCAATLLRPAWSAVATFRVRALIAAALVMVPFGSNLEFTSLAYAQWPQMLWLFLLLLEPPTHGPTRVPVLALRGIWVVLLTMTNPLALVLLPLGLARNVRRADRLDWVCYVYALLGYWLVALLFTEQHIAPTLAALWSRVVPAVGVNVVLEAFVGVGGADALASAGTFVLTGVATLLCVSLGVVVRMAWPRWSSAARFLVLACLWLLVATIASSLVARPGWTSNEEHCVRYAWLGRAAVWMVATMAIATLWRFPVALLLVALGAVGLVFGNAPMHYHPGSNDSFRAFVANLKAQEQELGGRRGIRARHDRRGGMPIVVGPR